MSERKPWIVGESSLRDAPPVRWAVDRLEAVAAERGLDVGETLSLAFAEDLHPEGYRLRRAEASRIDIAAGGPVGASYAISDLADRISLAADPATALAAVADEDASPAVPVRGILRSFSSDTLDRPWLLDRDFWTSYLDELAAQRINWFQLAFGMQYNYSHEEDCSRRCRRSSMARSRRPRSRAGAWRSTQHSCGRRPHGPRCCPDRGVPASQRAVGVRHAPVRGRS